MLGASNLKSFQDMYLKFAENVDILLQIVYKKFENSGRKDNGILGAQFFFFPKMLLAACITLLCYSTMSKLQPSIVRDTGNNI